MNEFFPSVLLANGFLPDDSLRVPEGQEGLYRWAGPVFLSLSMFFFGFWWARVRHLKTGYSRALVWAGVGCLAVSCTTLGVWSHQGRGIFYPNWLLGSPLLAVIAFGWWLTWRRLIRDRNVSAWFEMLAGCFAIGYFICWVVILLSDLNWIVLRGFGRWATVTMPWLWAGGCGAVILMGWRQRLSPTRLRVQTACAVGASGGFFAWCLVGDVARDVLYSTLGTQRDHAVSILYAAIAFCIFTLGGSIIGARIIQKRIRREECSTESPHLRVANQTDSQSPESSPASISSG